MGEWAVLGVIAMTVAGIGIIVYERKRLGTFHRVVPLALKQMGVTDIQFELAKNSFSGVLLVENVPLRLTVDKCDKYSGKSRIPYTRFSLRIPNLSGIAISRESVGSLLAKGFVGQDYQTNIREFDAYYYIKGHDEAETVSYLGHEVRDLLNRIFSSEAGYEDEQIAESFICIMVRNLLVHEDDFRRPINDVVALGKAFLNQPSHPLQRLAQHAMQDQHPGFRQRCFELLYSFYPGEDETKDVATQLLDAAEPAVRLQAARALGGPLASKAALALLQDSDIPDELRLETMGFLTLALASQDAELPKVLVPVLEDLVSNAPQPEFVEAAFTGLLQINYEPSLAFTLKALDRSKNAPVFATQLGHYPLAPEAEATLMLLLDESDPPLCVAALQSLGKVARLETIESILPLTEGMLRKAEIKQSAKDAIVLIRERLANASRQEGQLSLSETSTQAGGVSLLADASNPGALSDPQDDT